MQYKTSILRTSIIALLFLVSACVKFISYDGASSIKYLLPFTFSLIVVCFLFLTAPYYNTATYFTNFVALTPFLIWGGSVMIPIYYGYYWPLLFVILCFFLLVQGPRIALSKTQALLDSNEALFWFCIFFMAGLRVIGYILEALFLNSFSLHIFINWAASPFIFCLFIFTLRLSYTNVEVARILVNASFALIAATLLMIITEMITRGQNFGLNFILHGANGGYSGSESDVTGGHGEPLVLGMSAAFVAIICLYLKKTKYLIPMLLLCVFAMSLRPMLVAGAIVLSIALPSLLRNGGIKSIFIIMLSIAAFCIYSDVFVQKFLGQDSTSGTIDYGAGIRVGYNIAYYFRNLQWANYYSFDLQPIFQTITSFIVGGNEGTHFLRQGFTLLPFFIGFGKVLLTLFFVFFTIKKAGVSVAFPLTVLLIIYCYLDPFQPLYSNTLQAIELGSVPRESPIYFFILFSVTFYYVVRFYKEDATDDFSLKSFSRSVFNRL